MEHLALYRKYRPRTFSDVCGQEHITSVLKYESAAGRLSHAYLFCGSRGTGKTTCAKILSKAVNCDSPVNGDPCGRCPRCLAIDEGSATDVVEMDAASNTGVEYIRDIRDEVTYTPAMMKKRVYIIDEVHMLSMGAFNALLKTLEEPPEHVVFILATTEQHKLPATIISRCQRFDFRRIGIDDISARLMYIAENEGISLENEGARLIAGQAQGGMRDAINLFELCAGGGHAVTAARVREVLGITGMENAHRCALAVKNGDFESLFASVADVVGSSKDVLVFWQELISFWRDMLVAKSTRNMADYLDLTAPDAALVTDAASRYTTAELVYQSSLLDDAYVSMQRLPQIKRNFAELTLVRMASPELDVSPEALTARLSALEDRVKLLGSSAPAAAATAPAIPDGAPAPAAVTQGASNVRSDKAKSAEGHEGKVTEAAPWEDDTVPVAAETAKGSLTSAPAPKAKDPTVGSKPQITGGRWREVTDKSELLEKIAAINPPLKGFMQSSVCYVSADRATVLVKASNPFMASMLSRADSLQTISDAVVTLGAADPGCEVKVEQGEPLTSADTLLDELEF